MIIDWNLGHIYINGLYSDKGVETYYATTTSYNGKDIILVDDMVAKKITNGFYTVIS